MVGTNTVSNKELWLKRLYVKPEMKRTGIGSALLNTVYDFAKTKGIVSIHTRFADDYEEALHFYSAQGFVKSENIGCLQHFIKKL